MQAVLRRIAVCGGKASRVGRFSLSDRNRQLPGARGSGSLVSNSTARVVQSAQLYPPEERDLTIDSDWAAESFRAVLAAEPELPALRDKPAERNSRRREDGDNAESFRAHRTAATSGALSGAPGGFAEPPYEGPGPRCWLAAPAAIAKM